VWLVLDEKIQGIIRELEQEGIPPNYTLPVSEVRRLSKDTGKRFAAPPPNIALVRDVVARAPDARIPVRVYVPRKQIDLPVLVYFHGGGWVVGDLDTADWLCRSIAVQADCVVFSVDYRLAPENKFPIPVEDCYWALKWVTETGIEPYADLRRVAVGGDSAGGNLAAAVCLMARDRGGPAISFQLLICPITNHSFDTASYRKYADGYLLTLKDMEWFWNHYLRDQKDGRNPYASPLLGDLRSLPPALIMTAEFDPLRDEGEGYAERLQQAGVPVRMVRYDSMIHTWTDFPQLKQTTTAIGEAAIELRKALGA
jgi:acetyl esterase